MALRHTILFSEQSHFLENVREIRYALQSSSCQLQFISLTHCLSAYLFYVMGEWDTTFVMKMEVQFFNLLFYTKRKGNKLH